MNSKVKSSSQTRILDLENKLIALQRELDEARRQSVSVWCKIRDFCTENDLPEEQSLEITNGVSKIINDWVRDQRSKINNRYSVLSTVPPYTDCLNDIVVSISDPSSSPELPPYSHESEDNDLEPFGRMSENTPLVSRIPPPPISAAPGPSEEVVIAQPRMMRVNVPKGNRVSISAQQ